MDVPQEPRGANSAQSAAPMPRKKSSRRCLAYLPVFIVVPFLVALQFARANGPWVDWESLAAKGASIASPASRVSVPSQPAKDEPRLMLEALSKLPPDEQAVRLLDRAVKGDTESLTLIHRSLPAWRGRLHNTGRLFDLVIDGLNTDDLRVRIAATEIDLAANNLSKSSESVALLIKRLRNDPDRRPFALWRLGALGNRGVEPETVLSSLLAYAHDPDEQTRYWVVEGLAMLGNETTIDPLLDFLGHDPSLRIRERAAHNLGQSGLLTKRHRLSAVPDLLNFLEDDSLDTPTRNLVFQALRDISGQTFTDNPAMWRHWWMHQDRTEKDQRRANGILHA